MQRLEVSCAVLYVYKYKYIYIYVVRRQRVNSLFIPAALSADYFYSFLGNRIYIIYSLTQPLLCKYSYKIIKNIKINYNLIVFK